MNQRGITIIALVVTIVVLIIIAGVSIGVLLGENGLITRAKKAVEDYQEAQQEEANALKEMERYFNNIVQTEDGTFILQVIPENDNWSETKTVTASTNLIGYEIKMKLEGGEYEERSSIEVDKETIVYATLWDSIYDVPYGEELSLEIVRVGTAEYTVNHYLENLDGTYGEAIETEKFVGNVRTEIAPSTKEYEGFIAPEIQKDVVAKDGSTVVNYIYTRNTYTLTLNKGEGIERVEGEGVFKYGQEVTISAITASGYTWKEWTGQYTSTDSIYTFTMPAMDVVQTANTTVNSYTLTLNKGEGIASVTGAGTYKYGETVTIKATVSNGYTWSKWTGTREETTQTYTFTMPAENMSQTANATVNSYKVTVNKGTGIASVTGAGTYKYGESVTINATLSTGYSWSKWTGTKESTTQTYTFTMPAGNVTQTANATINSYKVTVNKGTGIASVTGAGTYKYGESVTINATLSTGYSWSKWTGTKESTTQKYTFTMPAGNVTQTANATINSYTVTLNKGTGIASVTGAGTYKYGATVTISATVSTGYTWSKWTGTKESTTQSYTFTMPAGNVTQTANTTVNSYTLSFDSMGGSSVTSKKVNYNAAYGTLTSPTWSGYTFNGWYTAKTGGTKVSSTTKMAAKNTTLYAQWTKNAVAKGDTVLDYGTVKNWYVLSVSGDNIKVVSKNNVGSWTETGEAGATEVSRINNACKTYTLNNSGGTVKATCSGNLTLADINSYDGTTYSLNRTVTGSIFQSALFWLGTNCTETYEGPYYINWGTVKYAYPYDQYTDTAGLRPVATITKSNLKWNSEHKYWTVI